MAAPWSGHQALCPSLAWVINTEPRYWAHGALHWWPILTLHSLESLEPRGDGIVKKKLYWERIKVWDVCIIYVEGPGLNREKAAGSGRAGLSRSDQTLEPEQFITSRHNIVEPDYRWIANELFVITLPFDSLTFELSDGDHPGGERQERCVTVSLSGVRLTGVTWHWCLHCLHTLLLPVKRTAKD